MEKSHCTPNIGTNQVVAQHDIAHSGLSQHLRFGERCRFVSCDAQRQLPLDDRGHLVGLAMRPQPLRRVWAGHLHNESKVVLQVLTKHQQLRTEDVVWGTQGPHVGGKQQISGHGQAQCGRRTGGIRMMNCRPPDVEDGGAVTRGRLPGGRDS